MNSVAMVDSLMCAAADCEVGSGLKASAPGKAGKPSRAFADTPPIAKMRETAQSDKSDSLDSDVYQEQTIACCESSYEELVSAQKATQETTDAQDNPAGDEIVTPAGDLPVAYGDFAVTSPGEEAVQAGSVPETRVAGDVEGAVEGWATPQSEPNPPALPGIDETSDAGFIPTTPNASDTASDTAEDQAIVTEGTVVAPVEVSGEMSAGQADAQPADSVKGDSPSGTADTPIVESAVGADNAKPDAVVESKTDVVVPNASGPIDAVQAPPAQQVFDQNANRAEPHGVQGQSATATVEAVASDPSPSESPEPSATALGTSTVQIRTETGSLGPQAKAAFSAELEKGPTSHTEPVVETPNDVSPTSDSALPQTNGVSGLEVAGEKSPVHSVAEQILDSVQAASGRADQQILVRLDPPELGSVLVRFQEKEGEITGVLEVSRDQTRHEVEQALPQVVRGLQDAGILVRRVEVVVTDQSEGDLDRDPLPQDAWGQQEGSQQQNPQAGDASPRRWSTWAAAQQSPLGSEETGPLRMSVTQDRIDMLV